MSRTKVLVRIAREQVIYAAVPADEIDEHGFALLDDATMRDWFSRALDESWDARAAWDTPPPEWRDATPYEDHSDSDDTIAQRLDAGTLVMRKVQS